MKNTETQWPGSLQPVVLAQFSSRENKCDSLLTCAHVADTVLLTVRMNRIGQPKNKMKTASLQTISARYNCTMLRACTEILCAAGLQKRSMRAVIRKQTIPAELIEKANAYRARKITQA